MTARRLRGRIPIGWLALMLFLAALAARLAYLNSRGLWGDEFWTVIAIRLPLPGLIENRITRGHLPTYFLLLKPWYGLFGESEWSLRMPSAIASAAAVPLLYLFVARLWNPTAALWAALFLLLNQRAVWTGQEARSFCLILLAAAGSFHALVHALEGKRRWVWAYGLWSFFGALQLAIYPLLFIWQGVVTAGWLIWRRRWRWGWAVAWLIVAAAAAAAYLYLGAHATESKTEGLPGWYPWRLYAKALTEVFWGEFDYVFPRDIFRWVGLALAVGVIAAAGVGSRRMSRAGAAEGAAEGAPPALVSPVFGWWLGVTWAMAVLVSFALISGLFQVLDDSTRYFTIGTAGAAALSGVAVASISRRVVRRIAGLALLALLAANTAGWYMHPGDQIREAVRLVAEQRRPDEPVFICRDTQAETIADYYGLGTAPIGIPRARIGRFQIERILEEGTAGAPGFWIILYKERHTPLLMVARRWAEGKFELQGGWNFSRSRVQHYVRGSGGGE